MKMNLIKSMFVILLLSFFGDSVLAMTEGPSACNEVWKYIRKGEDESHLDAINKRLSDARQGIGSNEHWQEFVNNFFERGFLFCRCLCVQNVTTRAAIDCIIDLAKQLQPGQKIDVKDAVKAAVAKAKDEYEPPSFGQ